MQAEQFIQNVKKRCIEKNVKQTIACKESGVGASFLNDIARGQTPSVAKVQALASYLDVTTSQLLGETDLSNTPSSSDLQQDERQLVGNYRELNTEGQRTLLETAEAFVASGKYDKKNTMLPSKQKNA